MLTSPVLSLRMVCAREAWAIAEKLLAGYIRLDTSRLTISDCVAITIVPVMPLILLLNIHRSFAKRLAES
jgi:hypothetical protein